MRIPLILAHESELVVTGARPGDFGPLGMQEIGGGTVRKHCCKGGLSEDFTRQGARVGPY
jgi:hypothetical protein